MKNYAQNDKYIIKNYQSKDGLPQNSVISIQFDKQGFCWFTTEAGLVKYDNHKFTTFNTDQLKTLSSNRMRIIAPNKHGELFISNINNDCITINTNTGIETSKPFIATSKKRIITNKGYSISVGSYYDSIIKLEKTNNDIPFLHVANTFSNGELYFHNNNKLYYLKGDYHITTTLNENSFSHESPLEDIYFMQVYKHNNVNLWKDGKLFKYNTKIYGKIINNRQFLKGNFTIHWTPEKIFILAQHNIYSIYTKNDSIYSELELENINIPNINTIKYLKNEKRYFIGSSTNGLYILYKKNFQYYQSSIIENRENYNTLIKDDYGNIIANNNKFYPNGKSEKINLINQDYLYAYINKDKIIYDGNFKLNIFDLNSNKLATIGALKGRLKSSYYANGKLYLLESHRIITIIKDRIYEIFNFPNTIDANGIIPYSKDTGLLFTTKGIYKFNYNNGSLSHHILNNIPVRNILKEKKDQWWITTDGIGAYLYYRGTIIPFPKNIPNELRTAHSFILDKNENFWIPTNNGLYTIKRKKLLDALLQKDIFYFYHYDNQDGLRTDEFNGSGNPSYLWINNQTLVLPTINGLVRLNTLESTPIIPKSKIYLESLFINDTINERLLDSIKVNSDFYNIKIGLTSPYFGNDDNNPIEYKILGISSNWEKIDRDGFIHINNLPYGSYTLRIRKAIDNPKYQNELDIHLIVKPYYYETLYFKAGCIFIIILILFFVAKYKLHTLKKNQKNIELIVKQRTAELRNNLFTLERTKEKLYNSNIIKERTIAIVLHDLRSPIRFIGIISKDLFKKIKTEKQIPSQIYESMDALNKSLLSLEEYSIQFFSWAKSQQENFHVHYSHFSLKQLFQEIENLYKEILLVQNNKLNIQDVDFDIYSDRFILSIIIRNLLDNANKNMTEGIVHMSAIILKNEIQILIQDTGPGINNVEQKKYQSESDNYSDKDGMGHSIVMDLAPKIKAKIAVQSSPEKGTTFSITINHHPQYDIYEPNDLIP